MPYALHATVMRRTRTRPSWRTAMRAGRNARAARWARRKTLTQGASRDQDSAGQACPCGKAGTGGAKALRAGGSGLERAGSAVAAKAGRSLEEALRTAAAPEPQPVTDVLARGEGVVAPEPATEPAPIRPEPDIAQASLPATHPEAPAAVTIAYKGEEYTGTGPNQRQARDEVHADARNPARAIALVEGIEWPAGAVRMVILDEAGAEVHSISVS